MSRNLIISVLLAAAGGLHAIPAPDFTITDSNGKTHNLYADYVNKGKVVVLEIFFTTCPPCATHAPHWQSLYESVKNDYGSQVEFFILSNKNADLNSAVAQYKVNKSLTMPGAGSDGGSLAAVQPYENGQFGTFYGTPTFVVITPGTGEVIFDVRGSGASSTMNLLRQQVDQLLAGGCTIETIHGDTLKRYQITVAPPAGNSIVHQVTNGFFSTENIPGLPPLPFFTVTPYKNDDPLNGVSTFDLLQINKQILGVEPFLKPWQFVAADANNSGTITTFDIVELRKLILGIYDSLPNSPSWVFSPPFDTLSPLECPYFITIKKGDVNGNADPAGLLQPEDRGETQGLWLDWRAVPAGETVRLTVRTGARQTWQGMQFALQYDPEALVVKSVSSDVLSGLDNASWHDQNGRLSLSWFAVDAVDVPARGEVLTLEVEALRPLEEGDGFLPDAKPLRAEAYTPEGRVVPIAWHFQNGFAEAGKIAPNPARGHFTVWVEQAVAEDAMLEMTGSDGRVVFRQRVLLTPGANSIDVWPNALESGLYALHLGGRLIGKVVWTP